VISEIRHEDGVTVVTLEGRIDAICAPRLKVELHELIAEGRKRLVVNLDGIGFIDSAGLGVLVSCLRRCAAEDGDLRLAEVPAFCRSIFELTRLTRVFDVTESEQEALQALRSDD
jgi:anti-sigma B factor antagonist